MALDYNPINFKQMDLRKYHVKDLQDTVKFCEFVISRLEEVRQVARRDNNRISTLSSLSAKYKQQARETIAAYGNPNAATEEVKVETIVPAEATSVEAEHNALLNEIRGVGNTSDERRVAEILVEDTLYRIVDGKKRVMFYKDGRLVKDDDVPEDIRNDLISALGNASEAEEETEDEE